MDKTFNAIVAEDSQDDALLMVRELSRQGFTFEWSRVETAEQMRATLENTPCDIVISDYKMPRFSAVEALKITREWDPELPFIVVSGTIGESVAVEMMKEGAHDYLMKGNLTRLGQAIERAIGDAEIRRQHRTGLEKIHHLNRVLRAFRNIGRLIVREKDPQRLIEGACECLVEERGYVAAWIALLGENNEISLTAGRGYGAEWSDFSEHLLAGKKVPCAEAALSRSGAFYLEKQTPSCRNCPLVHHMTDKRALVTRIEHHGRVHGVMGMKLLDAISDDDEEKSLLMDIADDIGFALHSIAQEQAFAAETALTETLFDAIPDTVFVFEPTEGRAVRWNNAFRAVSGYTDEEIAALPAPASYYDADDLERANQVVAQLVQEGHAKVELGLLSKDGRKKQFEYVATTAKGSGGGNSLSVAIGRDITERRKMEAQLAQSDRLASMGMLAAGVAHEINNPLAYVLYNLETLNKEMPALVSGLRQYRTQLVNAFGVDSLRHIEGGAASVLRTDHLDDILDRLKHAFSGTERIRDISRSLGTFARVEEDEIGSVDLPHVADTACNMAHNELKYRAKLLKEFDKVPTVRGNEGRLCQVFLNLIVNAAYAIDEGNVARNTIRVRTWLENKQVCASVQDTGKGIEPEYMGKLFEPFFTTRQIGSGSGLGLPISKNIVENYGGTIQVESRLGEGTTFTIRLPAEVTDARRPDAPSLAATAPQGRGRRILIVDDEEFLREAMVDMLREFETEQAGGGGAAKKILEEDQNFDLIVCDLMMPEISGMDLHEWLVSEHPELARNFIFTTGGAFTPRAQEYLKNVDIVIIKPFEARNFVKIVSQCLDT